ncbi:hypothetical protein T265_04667 [Opisthorchis viverrini]|uniref:Uncharacterized protein n=1 Tax=Opisthorchis viverrini TaxID=6198 RepID=A0A074ZMB3_OPIVI|nr:hypothetical protein T265_04667 [Opisthorchis viverrini]KER28533.1 hypothetical protein T265_04667 [Opisthorchis viverrini]
MYATQSCISSPTKAEKFVAKFNSEEMERTDLSTNRPRRVDAAGTRTAAHGMDAKRIDYYTAKPGFNLPKIELVKLSGNPIAFWKFMKAFQMSVADRLLDDSNKLMYLLHYCCGEAMEAIEHCVFLPGKTGYQRAMDILKTQIINMVVTSHVAFDLRAILKAESPGSQYNRNYHGSRLGRLGGNDDRRYPKNENMRAQNTSSYFTNVTPGKTSSLNKSNLSYSTLGFLPCFYSSPQLTKVK